MVVDAKTVFLVDDDPAIRKSLTSALEKRGLRVEVFESAPAFLECYRHDRPGCLLLDLGMPGMSGLELQERLSRANIDIPVIFITGQGDIPQSVQAIKAGAIDFLEKPFQLDVLLARISQAFAADASARAAREERDRVRQRFSGLTQREVEIMKLMISGAATMTSKEIAKTLGISHRTVDHHRARIMEKTDARSVAELARLASTAGFTG